MGNFKITIFVKITLLLTANAVTCKPKLTNSLQQMCALTIGLRINHISLKDGNLLPGIPGLPPWHSAYTLCCQMCNMLDSRGDDCFGYNFLKEEMACELMRERPYSFNLNENCIFAQKEKTNEDNCQKVKNFNQQTIPDNKAFTCPVYAEYPLFIEFKQPARINIGLGRPTFNSSLSSGTYSSCFVVDGNTNPFSGNGSCFRTFETAGSANWIIVDLQDNYVIELVTVTNRMDAGRPVKLEKFFVGLLRSYSPGMAIVRGGYALCGQYPGATDGIEKLDVYCEYWKEGRYVVIQIIKTRDFLNFCEIEIFGNYKNCEEKADTFTNTTYPDNLPLSCPISNLYPTNLAHPVPLNLALGRPVTVSSLYMISMNSPCNAVDGDACGDFNQGHCVSTTYGMSTTQWVMVDLQSRYNISRVVISNRFECCDDKLTNLRINVLATYNIGMSFNTTSGSQCGFSAASSTNTAKVKVVCAGGVTGRYVVAMRAEFINFCEMEVYGTAAN